MIKIKNRILAALVTLTLVVGLFPAGIVVAAGSPEIKVGSATADITNGSTQVKVPVEIKNNPGFAGLDVKFSTPKGWTLTEILSGVNPDTDNPGPSPEYTIFCDSVEFSGLGVFATQKIEPTLNPAAGSLLVAEKSNLTKSGFLCWLIFSVPEKILNDDYTINIVPTFINNESDTGTDMSGQFTFTSGKVTVTGGIDRSKLAPSFSVQPKGAVYTYNQNVAKLVVAASVPSICSGPTYQWYKNNTNSTNGGEVISGATGTEYQPEKISGTTYYYYCKATAMFEGNPYITTSDVVAITYNQAGLPAASLDKTVFTYTGSVQGPKVTIEGLTEGKDYVISGKAAASDAGEYTLTVTGKGNYKGEVKLNWTIKKAEVAVPKATAGLVYNGSEQIGVAAGKGYTVTGNKATVPGEYTAVATLDKNHVWAGGSTEVKNVKWSVAPKTLTADVSGISVTKAYDATTAAGKLSGEVSVDGLVDADDVIINAVAGAYPAADVGSHKIVLTLTLGEDKKGCYKLSESAVEIDATITRCTDAKKITDTTNKNQNVVVGVGSFAQPTFTGIGGEAVTGTTVYTYGGQTKTKAEIETALAKLAKGAETTIGYTFTANGNYNVVVTGTIEVTMVDILFHVGTDIAAVGNAVTIKDKPTYGDTWAQIVTIKSASIVASVDGKKVNGTYTLDVSGRPNAGTHAYKVVFNDGDRYKDVVVVEGTVTVTPKSVNVSWTNTALTYNGEAQVPTATATGLDGALTLTVTGAQKNAGENYTATAAITDGNYTLTNAAKVFAIAPKSVAVVWATESFTYNGKAQAPAASAAGVGDYSIPLTVTGKRIDAGSGTAVAATEDGNYALTNTQRSFTIARKPLAAEDLTFGVIANQEYTGQQIKPEVTITHTIEVLDSDDFMAGYTSNVNAGTAKISITGKGNYSGTVTDAATFVIAPKSVAVVWAEDALIYNGKEQIPAATAVGANSYKIPLTFTGEQKNAGTGYIASAATTDGNYALTNATRTFDIAAKDLTAGDLTISAIADWIYTGQEIKPAVTVTHKVIRETLSTADIDVTFTGNTNVGAAKVTITGKGNYSGIVTDAASFNIKPAAIAGTVTITSDTAVVAKDTVLSAVVKANTASVTYQWLKNGTAIEGATGKTYTVVEGDAAAKLTVKVTASGNYTGSLTSAAVEVGKAVLTNAVSITASGEIAVGAELTAVVTGDADESNYTIVWLANGTAIAGANTTTYTIAKADQGKNISVKLVGKNNYNGEVVSNNAVDVPAATPDAPVVSASSDDGQVSLYWAVPANNGSAITGYKVKMGEGSWIDVGSTRYTFTGLTNGTKYTFYVVAVNAVGTSVQDEVEATPEYVYIPPYDTSTPSVTTQTDGSGNVGKTTVGDDGTVTAQVDMNKGAAQKAALNGDTIKLPVSELTASMDAAKASVVTVNTGIANEVKVEIPVKGVTANTVVAVVGEDGSLTVIRDSVVTKTGVVAGVTGNQKLAVISVEDPFTDVAATHWGSDAVSFVYSRKLFAGVSETKFDPESPINRAMIAQVLYNLVSNPSVKISELFDDVASGKWYTNAIAWAAGNKIVSGYGNGIFGTEKNITREELATMLWNYAGTPAGSGTKLAGFVDSDDVSSWAKAAMSWAVENGVVAGKGGKVIDPQGEASRVEAAQMMKNFLEHLAK